MDYNYHTHTYRCHHAVNEDEEYVLRAIEGGVKRMGFSDHAPFLFPGGLQSDYRIPVQEVEGYFSSINRLREKYKDRISIKIGFEMEYYPAHFDEMLKYARKCGAEYLILGQHQLQSSGLGQTVGDTSSTAATDDPHHLALYTESVLAAINSGVFTYVAHPDIIKFTGDSLVYKEYMASICLASKEKNVPLEINFLGIRQGRHYPKSSFWGLVGEIGSPVTFGCDAHRALDAYDPTSLKIAEETVRTYSLNYVGEPRIISIQ